VLAVARQRRRGHALGMITLTRGADSLSMSSLLWDASQVFAKKSGWRPAGATGAADNVTHSLYGPGRIVDERDATRFATALEQAINGSVGDNDELDLGELVGLVNFLRGGAFGIR
jgi:hypothetical protein